LVVVDGSMYAKLNSICLIIIIIIIIIIRIIKNWRR
jgi:hypothetical protein